MKTKSSRLLMSTQGVRDRAKTSRLTGITEMTDSLSFSSKEALMADPYSSEGLFISIQIYAQTQRKAKIS